MNLHPAEVPSSENDDCSNYAYQFDEASLFTQLQSFSYSAAACSGQMYFEHLRRNERNSQSVGKSIKNHTKLVNLASRGQLPPLFDPIFCSASLTALKKTKRGVRPIAVAEVF